MRKPVLSYANNKGADQHPRSLLASAAEQAGLSMTWSKNSGWVGALDVVNK